MKDILFNKSVWYFALFAYIYTTTMSSFVAANELSAGRVGYLLGAVIFGFFAISNKVSNSLKILRPAIYFVLYMVLVVFVETENFSSFLIAVINIVLWVLVLFQTSCMKIGQKQMNAIGILMAVTCNILGLTFLAVQKFMSLEMDPNVRVAMANSVYYVFGFVPFVFLIRKWFISVIFLILPTYVFAVANKTTCLLCCALFILYFVIANIKSQKLTTKIGIILVAIAGLFALNAYVDLNEIVSGIDDDFASGGNGRTEIAGRILGMLMNETNIFLIFFGHGANSVANAIGIGSHNDFLEILYCYGLLGIVLFIRFGFSLLKTASSKIIQTPSTRIAYVISLIVFSFMVFASKVFGTQLGMIPFALMWGVVLANTRTNIES